MVNRFERRHIVSDQSAASNRSETQPNPDLALADTGFVAWNVPDRRRAAFRKLRDIVRWGITIRAPEVRMLRKFGSALRAIPCMYCGNTGTVNAAPCPVCRPGGSRGSRRDTWTQMGGGT